MLTSRTAALVVVVISLAAAAACTYETGPSPRPANVDLGNDCDIYGPYRGMIAAEPLPPGVVLASASRCLVSYMAPTSGDGNYQHATYRRTKQVADTGLDALATALRLPPVPPPPNQVCPQADTISGGALEVTDVQGRHYLPAWPTQRCGEPRPEVVSAIDALPWRVVGTDTLIPTPIPSAEGTPCFSFYDTVLDNGFFKIDLHPSPLTMMPEDPTLQPLQVCRYDLDTDPVNAIQMHGSTVIRFGRLTAVSTLEGQLAHDFWQAVLTADQVSTACTVQARFVVVWPPGHQPVHVELGGCYRVYVEGENFVRHFDAATVDRLFGSGG